MTNLPEVAAWDYASPPAGVLLAEWSDRAAAYILATDLDTLTDAQVGCALASLISGLSEDTTCAAWEYDCEHYFWTLNAPVTRWMTTYTPEAVDALRRCRERLRGGWVAWHSGAPGEMSGVALLDAAEWATATHNRRRPHLE
jgi:hypothetical protein